MRVGTEKSDRLLENAWATLVHGSEIVIYTFGVSGTQDYIAGGENIDSVGHTMIWDPNESFPPINYFQNVTASAFASSREA